MKLGRKKPAILNFHIKKEENILSYAKSLIKSIKSFVTINVVY